MGAIQRVPYEQAMQDSGEHVFRLLETITNRADFRLETAASTGCFLFMDGPAIAGLMELSGIRLVPAERERIEHCAGVILSDSQPAVFANEASLAQAWAALHKLHAVPLGEGEELFCGEWMEGPQQEYVN